MQKEEHCKRVAELWKKTHKEHIVLNYIFGYGFAGLFLIAFLLNVKDLVLHCIFKVNISDFSYWAIIPSLIACPMMFLFINRLGTGSLRFYKKLQSGNVPITIKEVADLDLHKSENYDKGNVSTMMLILKYTDGQRCEFITNERLLLKDVRVGDKVVIYGDPFKRHFTLPKRNISLL